MESIFFKYKTNNAKESQTTLPESKIPEEMHSKTRLSASPGLRGADALLMAFSTSSSMAWTEHTEEQKMLEMVGNSIVPFLTSLLLIKIPNILHYL